MSVDSDRIEKILGEALTKVDAAARHDYLDEACGSDSLLRGRIEAQLAAREASDLTVKLSGNTLTAAAEATPRERPGMTIGRFKLLEQLGEGGFGVVFLAGQEEPVRRKVALKVIKAGMDTKQVVARFEAERQALAMMDHPNIARVYDAGTTDDGHPYFVMELVSGKPITEYCDENNLGISQRLELFCQAANAVQHAHQKGLIHRDIKPTNVLAMTQDGRAAVKVIDFGVAKAMSAPLTDKTLQTEFHQLIGTPAYMSPEQAHGELDIDTRSDVYSLGVLLYELLAGAPPFDPQELGSKGFVEILRIIREVDPPTPSTRLNSQQERLPWIAAQRSAEPRKLSAMLRGELDWIVMRALEKERARRYQSASSLADDIERFLAEKPVEARPATPMYRFKKFVRRNRAGVFAGAAVLAALLAGATLAAIGFVQAQRQAEIARAEAIESARMTRRATQVQDFLRGMLTSINPETQASDVATVQEMLEKAAATIDSSNAKEPEVRAVLHETMGDTFYGMQLYPRAISHLQTAVDLRRHHTPNERVELGTALAQLARAELVSGLGRDQAAAHSQEAVDNLTGVVPGDDLRLIQARALLSHATGKSFNDVVVNLTPVVLTLIPDEQLAGLRLPPEFYRMLTEARRLIDSGEREQALALARRYHMSNLEKANRYVASGDRAGLQRLAHEHFSPFLEVPMLRFWAPGATEFLAELSQSGEFHPMIVEAILQEAIDLGRQVWRDGEHTHIAEALHELALVQRDQGQLDDAEKSAKEALAIRIKQLGPNHPETVKTREALVDVLERAHKDAEAAKLRADGAARPTPGEAAE